MSRFTRDDDINRELRRLLAITEVNAYPSRLYIPNSITPRVIVDSSGNVLVGDYSGGNYSQFETDGTLIFKGDAIVWEDQWIDWGQLSSGGWFGNEYAQLVKLADGLAIEFENNASYYYKTRFNVQINHRYVEGEDIEVHLHIYNNSNTSGDAVFKLTYNWANMEGTYASSGTTVTKTVSIDGVQRRHQYETIATLIGTGKKISSILMCQLERDAGNANDTFSESVYVIGIDFHIPCNSVGSRTMMDK